MGQHKCIIIYVCILFENTCSDSAFQVWIGMHDTGSTGHLRYTDFTPVDFTYWGSGQPDNWGEFEQCVQIRGDSKMEDIRCTSKRSFICKK